MKEKLQILLDAINEYEDEALKARRDNYAELQDASWKVFVAFTKLMRETDCWFEDGSITKIAEINIDGKEYND